MYYLGELVVRDFDKVYFYYVWVGEFGSEEGRRNLEIVFNNKVFDIRWSFVSNIVDYVVFIFWNSGVLDFVMFFNFVCGECVVELKIVINEIVLYVEFGKFIFYVINFCWGIYES